MSKIRTLAVVSALLVSLGSSGIARAYSDQDVNADLARHLTSTIEDVVQDQQTDAQADALAGPAVESSASTWDLSRIWLRLRPKAIFSVGIAKLEVSPDIEMLWKK